jgi:hypothetical protein
MSGSNQRHNPRRKYWGTDDRMAGASCIAHYTEADRTEQRRHLAVGLMLARPGAFLNARRAWLMALEGAARMLAAYLEEQLAGERVD